MCIIKGYFSFKRLVVIDIFKMIHILGIIAVIVLSINYIALPGLKNDILGGCIFVFGNLAWRVICEVMVVLFSINQNLEEIKKKIKK